MATNSQIAFNPQGKTVVVAAAAVEVILQPTSSVTFGAHPSDSLEITASN